MTLNADDRMAVTELLSLHGHLFDAGALDRLDELFTDDVVYDVTDFGREPLTGIAAIREATLALGTANPVAHHITNVVLTEITSGEVRALSKGLGVHADGTCGSVTYDDTVVRGRDGWRISRRRVIARRAPLDGA
ncbi:nuclear transport factor 2 family protein [Streptomyces sp. Ru72]|uniref:nuclear transport factor 2 family protein n=1 Tax=Streptomyces sp. Ru72 TaxID=2080747 RepID=UPI000CDDA731|nr:nuclear transport factor 2 family protein [Streptomyces sp. Ru72]POX43858.1 nuclear transport factor 2 family protein [Streptomyces sp. Ru72]